MAEKKKTCFQFIENILFYSMPVEEHPGPHREST